MKIKSLDNIVINGKSFDLYTKIVKDSENKIANGIYKFQCTDKHAMRLDLVSQEIYNSDEYIDVLTAINSILNVLSIKSGDIIYFMIADEMDDIRDSATSINKVIDAIKNANNKNVKKDNARKKDVNSRLSTEENKKLPPNIVDDEKKMIEKAGSKIIIKPYF